MKHYICPECEDEGDIPKDSKIKFCGICAGDTGRDVYLKFLVANKSIQQTGNRPDNSESGTQISSQTVDGEILPPCC